MNRNNTVNPGAHMVIDEVMSAWKGQDGQYCANGLPHVTKIIRKPEGVGCELKALCDGESNIMMRLEIMKGRDHQRAMEHAHQYKDGTAVTLFHKFLISNL